MPIGTPRPACPPELVTFLGDLVGRAGALALEGWGRGDLLVEQKADGSVVTGYDRAVERLLRDAIARRFPEDGILGEEEAAVVGTSGRRWVIDPIDGTYPYARGIVTWGCVVAVADEHGVLAGAVSCPWAGEAALAGRGLGCTTKGPPSGPSSATVLVGSVLATSGLEHWSPGTWDRLHAAGVKVRTWGNAYGLLLALTGRVDAFFDAKVKPWDIGPAPVLMAEAGGRYTTLAGTQAIDEGDCLLCGDALVEPLLALLRG